MSALIEKAPYSTPYVKRKRPPSPVIPFVIDWTLFFFGVLSWVFKLSRGDNQPILPASPLQVGLPLTALLAVMVIIQIWRLNVPAFMIRAWSMRLINLGTILVLIGTTFHIVSNTDYRIEAVLYFFRWLLPLCSLLFLFLSMQLGGNKDALVYGFLGGCLLSVIAVELDRRGLFTGVQKLGTRSGALLMHPNQYGILIASLSPFIVYLFHKPGLRPKVIAILSLPIFGLALFESLSKTNIIILPIACAITFLAYSLHDTKKLIKSTLIIVASFFIFAFIAGIAIEMVREISPKDFELLTQMTNNPTEVKTLIEREDAWHEALGYINESPWLGKGPGWAEDHLMYQHAHNMFLQHWIEVGLFGIIGVSLLTLGVICRNLEIFYTIFVHRIPIDNEFRLQIACVISLFAGIIGNCMSSSLNTGSMIPFCIVLALSCLNRKLTPIIKRHPW